MAVIISTVAMVGVVATSPASAQRTPATVRPASVEDGSEDESEKDSVTLTWDKGNADNDLFLIGPDGEAITYRRSTPMGKISLDDIATGPETFKPTSAADGRFQVKVRCFHLCEGSTVTVNAVAYGKPVSLGSHRMTAAKEEWIAGFLNFDPNYISAGMPTRSFNVRVLGVNDWWGRVFDDSRAAWNDSGAGTNIGRDTSAWSTFSAGSYPLSTFGIYIPHGARNLNRTFDIAINARAIQEYIDRNAIRNHREWCIDTVIHELGHALSLPDNPKTIQASIMKYDRYPQDWTSPTIWDVAQVRKIYS